MPLKLRSCKSLAGDRHIIAYIDIWAFLTTQQHPRHKCLSQIISQQKEKDVHHHWLQRKELNHEESKCAMQTLQHHPDEDKKRQKNEKEFNIGGL